MTCKLSRKVRRLYVDAACLKLCVFSPEWGLMLRNHRIPAVPFRHRDASVHCSKAYHSSRLSCELFNLRSNSSSSINGQRMRCSCNSLVWAAVNPERDSRSASAVEVSSSYEEADSGNATGLSHSSCSSRAGGGRQSVVSPGITTD